jgi:hypothetical protein
VLLAALDKVNGDVSGDKAASRRADASALDTPTGKVTLTRIAKLSPIII